MGDRLEAFQQRNNWIRDNEYVIWMTQKQKCNAFKEDIYNPQDKTNVHLKPAIPVFSVRLYKIKSNFILK